MTLHKGVSPDIFSISTQRPVKKTRLEKLNKKYGPQGWVIEGETGDYHVWHEDRQGTTHICSTLKECEEEILYVY